MRAYAGNNNEGHKKKRQTEDKMIWMCKRGQKETTDRKESCTDIVERSHTQKKDMQITIYYRCISNEKKTGNLKR